MTFDKQTVGATVVECPVSQMEIYLFDHSGKPVPNAKFKLELVEDTTIVRIGELDDNGRLKLDEILRGKWFLSFPDYSFDQWSREDKLTPARNWIEIELRERDGKPAADEPYQVFLPDGALAEGNLDSSGKARIDTEEPGICAVCFPDRDTDGWSRISD